MTAPELPAHLPALFGRLLARKAANATPAALEVGLAEWLAARDEALTSTEFIDLDAGALLMRASRLLLARWDRLPPDHRLLASAAILYFIETEDEDSDFDIGGLDDDLAVMRWTFGRIGLPWPPA